MTNDNKNIAIDDISRLQWACRRGMLELDLFLRPFLDEVYPALSDVDKQNFVRMLSTPDPDLFAWLMDKTPCDDAALVEIVSKVRQHAKNRV